MTKEAGARNFTDQEIRLILQSKASTQELAEYLNRPRISVYQIRTLRTDAAKRVAEDLGIAKRESLRPVISDSEIRFILESRLYPREIGAQLNRGETSITEIRNLGTAAARRVAAELGITQLRKIISLNARGYFPMRVFAS